MAQITEGRIVSIAGKRLCGSGTQSKKAIVHMVSAWCNINNMVRLAAGWQQDYLEPLLFTGNLDAFALPHLLAVI